MHINGHAVFSAVLQMIGLSEAAQRECPDPLKQSMSSLAWAKEFCTIKVCGPRGCGHTAAAERLVKHLDGRCVCLFPTHHMAARFRNRELDRQLDFNGRNPGDACVGVQSLDFLRGLPDVDAVIVDVASLLSQKQIDDVYRHFANQAHSQDCFFFIFLE